MNTSYRVSDSSGQVIGIYPQGELAAVRTLVEAHPGATVKPVVSYTACELHPAFEVGNCAICQGH